MRKQLITISGIAVFPLLLLLFCCSNETSKAPSTKKKDTQLKKSPPPYFLFISDIHLYSGEEGSRYGCDTGEKLWDATKKELRAILNSSNPPAFIVYTGDLPAHEYPCSSGATLAANRDTIIKLVLEDLLDLAGTTPLFYAPGNNDPLTGDYASFSDGACESPWTLLGPATPYPAPNATKVYYKDPIHGYYAATAPKGLRVIGMNTIMYSHNFNDSDHCSHDYTVQDTSCANQLTWVRNQLRDAKAAKEKAYLIMHIPPGVDAYSGNGMWENPMWEDSLLQITEDYQDVISGIFFGHTHMDELRCLVAPSDPSKITEVAISCPGISPIFDNNPGFKKVFINKQYEPTGFETHYVDLSSFVNGGSWGDLSYTFSNYFGTGKTVLKTIQSTPQDSVASYMNKFYTVQAAPSKSPYVSKGVWVK